jgi:phosphatidylglycerol:prolipoprotein diacylglycerol transferase
MLPTVSIGPVTLPVAPLVTIAAFWVALWLIAREGKRFGLDEDVIFNAGFYGALGGLIGARAWYVIEYWPYYQNRLGDIFALNLNTLAPLEGVLIGLLVAVIYLQRKHVRGAALFDALAPGLAAFAAGLSLANLASGAAYGEPANLPWAIELWDARRHPTQAYDLLLSLGVLWVTTRLARSGPPSGRAFAACIALLAASRLLTEGFRGDSALLDGGWRSMQFVWLAALLASLVGLAWIDLRARSAQAPVAGDSPGEVSQTSEVSRSASEV